MCVRIYVCLYVYIYVCIYLHICTYVNYVCVYIYMYLWICMYVYVRACMYMRIMCVHVYMYACMYVYICMYRYACLHRCVFCEQTGAPRCPKYVSEQRSDACELCLPVALSVCLSVCSDDQPLLFAVPITAKHCRSSEHWLRVLEFWPRTSVRLSPLAARPRWHSTCPRSHARTPAHPHTITFKNMKPMLATRCVLTLRQII
jgi:hypothetical protein